MLWEVIGVVLGLVVVIFALIGLDTVVRAADEAEQQRQAAYDRARTAVREITAISRRAQNAITAEALRRAQEKGQKP